MEFDAIYQGLITGEEKLALVGPFIRTLMGGIITFVFGVGCIFSLYIFFVNICLLFRKGTTGPNRFGEDPLQHVGVTPNP